MVTQSIEIAFLSFCSVAARVCRVSDGREWSFALRDDLPSTVIIWSQRLQTLPLPFLSFHHHAAFLRLYTLLISRLAGRLMSVVQGLPDVAMDTTEHDKVMHTRRAGSWRASMLTTRLEWRCFFLRPKRCQITSPRLSGRTLVQLRTSGMVVLLCRSTENTRLHNSALQ
jgi:hypothetical protein